MNSVNGIQVKTEVKLRLAEFDAACNARGWFKDVDRAREIGLAKSVMSRLRNRQGSASAEAIDKIITKLDVPYKVLFESVEAS